MSNTLKIILIFAFVSTLNAKDILVFAPLPMENRKTVFTQFAPMIKYLEEQLNKKIQIDYNKNYTDILKKITQGKIDIAYLGPLPYIELKEKYPSALPLIHFKNSSGSIFYTCSIVTFINNHTKIEDIINKKIALTQPLSTCGYLSVNALLKKSKNSLINNNYRYIGRHDKVALSIIRGEFEFGGIKSSIAKKYSNLGLKEITKTSPLPNFALIGSRTTLSTKTLKKIKNILITAKKEEFQLWGENIKYGFSEAKDEDYDSLRKLKSGIMIPTKGNF